MRQIQVRFDAVGKAIIKTQDKERWQVQVKGELSPDSANNYEISVIRKGNVLGQTSWGWGNLHKIILFRTGLNSFSRTKENIDFALWIANTLCTALNERGEI